MCTYKYVQNKFDRTFLYKGETSLGYVIKNRHSHEHLMFLGY
jgi:hypothetical protein